MANLLGQNIGTNYKGILNLDTINTPLDATLSAVTDGEGNPSPLLLSTDAVSVGAISGASLAVKGSGTTSDTTSLLVQNSAGVNMIQITDDITTTVGNQFNIIRTNVPSQLIELNANFSTIAAGIRAGGNAKDFVISAKDSRDLYLSTNFATSITQVQFALKHNQGVFIADNASVAMAANTKLHIKGSGTTSATVALLVQNSAGATALQVYDHLDTRVFGGLQFNNGNTFIVNISNTLQISAINGATSDLHLNPNRQVNINNTGSYTAQASAILQVDSTTKGFLPPRMTTTQKNAIATPASGLIVYDETTNKLACYNGTSWNDLF